MEEKSFKEFLDRRINEETKDDFNKRFWQKSIIQKAYFIGAYAKSIIVFSLYSRVSKGNVTFKKWLSNQIINARNLDRIFEMCFRFESKLQLNNKKLSNVRDLSHSMPQESYAGVSSAKISFAFVAGYDDFSKVFNVDDIEEKKEN